MTTVSGTFISCPGNTPDYSFTYSCTGTSCSILKKLPNATCAIQGSNLNCNNGKTCTGPSNYTSNFSWTVDAHGDIVSRTNNVTLWDGFGYLMTSNGSENGLL